MKKQFIIAGIMILIGVCCRFSSDNSLKACVTNTAGCSSIKGKTVIDKSIREKIELYFSSEHMDNENTTYDMLMNPLIQL